MPCIRPYFCNATPPSTVFLCIKKRKINTNQINGGFRPSKISFAGDFQKRFCHMSVERHTGGLQASSLSHAHFTELLDTAMDYHLRSVRLLLRYRWRSTYKFNHLKKLLLSAPITRMFKTTCIRSYLAAFTINLFAYSASLAFRLKP